MTPVEFARLSLIISIIVLIVNIVVLITLASAHDPDNRTLDPWYNSIKQPDGTSSCCGVADAYFCNNVTVQNNRMFCTVTDKRDDKSRGRPHVPFGTVVHVPAEKLVRDGEARKGNPTGQGVVWMRAGNYDPTLFMVFCYLMPELT